MSPSTVSIISPSAFRDHAILCRAARGVVEHRDVRTGSSEHRSLLPAPGRKAKHVKPFQRRETTPAVPVSPA